MRNRLSGLFLSALLLTIPASAETGYSAWLRYAAIEDGAIKRRYDALPASVSPLGDSALIKAAQRELIAGVRGMLGRTLRAEVRPTSKSTIILGTLGSVKEAEPSLRLAGDSSEDVYLLKRVTLNGCRSILITASNDRGVLYGVFALLRKIRLGEP